MYFEDIAGQPPKCPKKLILILVTSIGESLEYYKSMHRNSAVFVFIKFVGSFYSNTIIPTQIMPRPPPLHHSVCEFFTWKGLNSPVWFFFCYRRKTRWELIRLCAVVMGIEFAYAAITAFSSPILLEIGVPQNLASLVFSLSPILGFFLSPFTGSLSDNCTFRYGRRRIFMLGYALFEVVGESNPYPGVNRDTI